LTVQKWYVPTRKWWTLLVTGAAAILGSWIVTGAFDDVERGMSATLLASLATTWAVPNEKVARRRKRTS
jgi:hypothetical protein